ncbi:MAG: hypothetical protein VB131_08000, partial [Burkholderia gladioli]
MPNKLQHFNLNDVSSSWMSSTPGYVAGAVPLAIFLVQRKVKGLISKRSGSSAFRFQRSVLTSTRLHPTA